MSFLGNFAFLLLIPLFLLSVFPNDARAKSYKFPVRRFDGVFNQRMQRRMALNSNKTAERIHRAYLMERNQQNMAGAYHQEVFDYYDLEYIASISIGSPAQEFEIVLDTGSANLWVPDSSCDWTQPCDKLCKISFFCTSNCDEYCCGEDSKESTCDKKSKFQSKKSKTYVKHGQPFQIMYGTGFVDGYLGMDTVKFGAINDKDVLSVPNTFFGQTTSMGKFFRDQPMDGILGLAFKSIAVDGVAPPLLNAMAQGLLDKPMFTVYLETEGVNAVNKAGGVFTWGGLDKDNCGDVIGWTPLTHETFYEFQIQGVSYTDKYKSNKKQKVISDTGTSLIIGPKNMVQSIAEAIGDMTWDTEDGLYLVPCDKNYDPVKFTINDKQYSLTKDVLTIPAPADPQHPEEKVCIFGLVPNPMWWIPFQPAWILGDPFIRQYCNVHDIGNKQIGFALAKQP